MISGDRPDFVLPGAVLPEYAKLWKASWNDTYLMWEMLVKPIEFGGKGYSNDHVFVLWADGLDWPLHPGISIDDRYNPQERYPEIIPPPLGQLVDYSATLNNVEYIFEKLADGTDPEIPQITQDDFRAVLDLQSRTL